MTEKWSIMMPLETLPYWEPAENPSLLVWLGFVIGLPILLTLMIILLVRAGDLARAFRNRDRDTAGAFWIHPGTRAPASLDSSEDETPFTIGEREALARAAVRAERASGLPFSVYVGPAPTDVDPANFAEELHDSLPDPDRAVLIMCDPDSDDLEFVLGESADRLIDDNAVAQAGVAIEDGRANHRTMNALTSALDQLAEHARKPKVLHADPVTA
ncbi:MAG: DUF5130 domain-containing protein [Propionibacteriales bacterium]|nr:DUF5130 domain-containing protein [Propionibacteriales bacterium]